VETDSGGVLADRTVIAPMKLTATQIHGDLIWVRRTWVVLTATGVTCWLAYSLTGNQIQPRPQVQEPEFLIGAGCVLGLAGGFVLAVELAIRLWRAVRMWGSRANSA